MRIPTSNNSGRPGIMPIAPGMPRPGIPQPIPQPEKERERERQREVSPAKEVSPTGSVVVRDAPDRVRIAEILGQTVRKQESYPERVARLQGLIDLQVEQVLAAADRKALDITDYKIVYAFDISGEAGEVCAFCGREGCQYKPVAILKENREIDLLKDAVTVAQEVAARLGVSYGLVAYDDDLIPLREVLPPDDLADRAAVLATFGKFKGRKDKPDITDRKWLDEMLAKWDISMKYRQVKGEPADRGMAELSTKMLLASSGQGSMALMVSKSQRPKNSMRPIESELRSAGISAAGLSLGKECEANARNMFSRTLKVKENHGLPESMGSGTSAALELEDA